MVDHGCHIEDSVEAKHSSYIQMCRSAQASQIREKCFMERVLRVLGAQSMCSALSSIQEGRSKRGHQRSALLGCQRWTSEEMGERGRRRGGSEVMSRLFRRDS